MDAVTLVFLTLAFLGVVGWNARRRRQLWQRVASRFGLQAVGSRFLRPPRIVGRAEGGVDVSVARIAKRDRRHGAQGIRYQASARGRIPHDLSLSREGLVEKLRKVVTGHDVLTGDPAFDARVAVRGRDAEAVSRLDHATRAEALILIEVQRGNVRDGTVEVVDPRATEREDVMVDRLRTVLTVARGLAGREEELGARLARLAASDRAAGVRWRALELLSSQLAGKQADDVLLAAAEKDPDPEVRLKVARLLGAKGLPALFTLADDPAIPGDVRAAALARLRRGAPREELVRRVRGWLGAPEALRAAPALAGEVCEAAAALGLGDAREAVRGLAELPGRAGVSAARALAVLGDVGAGEARLLRLLGGEDEIVVLAAAAALADVGTARAVAPLLERGKGWLVDGALKEGTRRAVAEIQARLEGAGAGQLSLVEEIEAGALSFPEEGGALSLAEEAQRVEADEPA